MRAGKEPTLGQLICGLQFPCEDIKTVWVEWRVLSVLRLKKEKITLCVGSLCHLSTSSKEEELG